MTELSLRAGQTLRIRGGSGLLLVLRPAAPCKVRVVKRGAALRIGRAILACWLRLHRFGLSAASARLMTQLHARALEALKRRAP